MIGEIWATIKSIARPCLLLGVVALLIGFIASLISPAVAAYSRPLYIAGLILLGVGVVGSAEEIRDLFVAPGTRLTTQAILGVIVFIAIIIFANAIFFRSSPKLDLTANARFTLSDQSKQVARNLERDIKVTGFFSGDLGASQEVSQNLLRQYGAETPRIDVQFYDPNAQPGLVRELGITSDGSVVFQAGDRKQSVTAHDEQSYTSAILKVLQAVQKKVYFVIGHNEREYNDFRDNGFGNLTQALRNDNYEVTDVNLLTVPEVPQDASVVIIADPKTRYQQSELDSIERFLNRGGKLLVLWDGRADTGLRPLLAKYGIQYTPDIPTGVVIDAASSATRDGLTPAVLRYQTFNEITRNLQITIYPRPGAIITTRASDGFPSNDQPIQPTSGLDYPLRLSVLAQTSDQSWIESTPDRPNPDPSEAVGPFTLALQLERFVQLGAPRDPNQPAGLRLVNFTDANFADNQFIGQFNNKDIVLNSVNWLAGDEQLISIRAKPADNRQLFVSQAQVPLVLVSSVILLPALVLVAGAVVWYRRR